MRTMVVRVMAVAWMGIGLFASPTLAVTIFSDDFSSDLGWTLDTSWEVGPATASSGHAVGNPDPALDATTTGDNGILGAWIGGNVGTEGLHPYRYASSPSVDTTGYSDVRFEFQRFLNSDYVPYMRNRIEVWSGGVWVTLWASGNAPGIQDASWTYIWFDVSAYTGPDFRVRFAYNVDSAGAHEVSGWNIDDFAVIGTPTPEPSTGLLLGLGTVGLAANRRRSASVG